MTREELQNELAKLNVKQRNTLAGRFHGYTITFLSYNDVTDAIAFDIVSRRLSFHVTAILNRRGVLKCVRFTD